MEEQAPRIAAAASSCCGESPGGCACGSWHASSRSREHITSSGTTAPYCSTGITNSRSSQPASSSTASIGLGLMAVPAYAAELSLTFARSMLASQPDGFVYLSCIFGSLSYSMGMGFSKLSEHVAW
ncbi:unnamed protein product [Urochloa humidicola]